MIRAEDKGGTAIFLVRSTNEMRLIMLKHIFFTFSSLVLLLSSSVNAQTNKEVNGYLLSEDICVQSGDSITITPSGLIRLGFFAGSAGPEGLPMPSGFEAYNLDGRYPHGALLCKIQGEYSWQYCGKALELTASTNGCLEFEVNDTDQGNNSGKFQVAVKVNSASARANEYSVEGTQVKHLQDPNGMFLVTAAGIYVIHVDKIDAVGDYQISLYQRLGTSFIPSNSGEKVYVGWWLPQEQRLEVQRLAYLSCGATLSPSASVFFDNVMNNEQPSDVWKRKKSEDAKPTCVVHHYRNCELYGCLKWSNHPDFENAIRDQYLVKDYEKAQEIFNQIAKLTEDDLPDTDMDLR